MAWRVANSLLQLRAQVNAAYPGRDKASDGGIGDAAHASRSSDHNPWVKDGKMGIVTAIDIDEDLNADGTLMMIVERLISSRDRRIKYIIYEGQMIRSYVTQGFPPWSWTRYRGVNAHKHHAHISVLPDKEFYDDETPWEIDRALPARPAGSSAEPIVGVRPVVRRGSLEVNSILFIQRRLGLKADGRFGPATETAVKDFQRAKGLTVDGIVGPSTWTRLLV